MRKYAMIGAWLAMLAVMLGAFGAHALKTRITPEHLAVFETGVRYHLIHAVALFALGMGGGQLDSKKAEIAGKLFSVGIAIFGLTLYGIAIAGISWLGAITPIGGVCLIAGWAFTALSIKHETP